MDLYWYDTGFDIFSIMFFLIFALITVTIMINIIKDITEWSNNNKQPILDINCKVVQKELAFLILTHIQMLTVFIIVVPATLHIMLPLNSKVKIEWSSLLMEKNNGMIAENDYGKLKFQGTRF